MYAIIDTRNSAIRVTSKSYDVISTILKGFNDKWRIYKIVRIDHA